MNASGRTVHPKEFLREATRRFAGDVGLQIAGALLHPRALVRRALKNGLLVARAWLLFKTPRSLIHHYFSQTAPSEKRIHFRDGRELQLSRHHLDVVALFQVFCERVYPTDRDTVVVDIGANIGLFSCYAAFSGARRVYAFEPNGEAYRCMLANISRSNLQGVIVPFQYAVTARSHEVVTIPKAASPQNRIAYGNADGDGHESVQTISLDDIVGKERIPCIDLLKMDCEGSEYDIMAGISESTFSRIDRIIVEYHDGKVGKIETDLKQRGFKLEKHALETAKMGMLWFRKG
jgi:FkbM family methyltransferase